jgi:hypothetical protein
LTGEEANSMDSIALGRGDVVVGVDTHKDEVGQFSTVDSGSVFTRR